MLITHSTQQTRDSKFETLIKFGVGLGRDPLQGTRKVVLQIVWQPYSVFYSTGNGFGLLTVFTLNLWNTFLMHFPSDNNTLWTYLCVSNSNNCHV